MDEIWTIGGHRWLLVIPVRSFVNFLAVRKSAMSKSGVRHQARLPHFFVPSTWNNNRQPVKSKINMHNAQCTRILFVPRYSY